MASTLRWINLALRALMELGIIVALGYWGYATADGPAAGILIAIGAPLLGFGFWGLVDFRRAGPPAELLRLIQELVISGLAAAAWYAAGAHAWGVALGLVSILHHALVYAMGDTLLKHQENSKHR